MKQVWRTMDRSIIHLNVADFAVAVERAVDCRLKDRPVIIAPEGGARTAVYDMSEEAYLAGIRKGMRLRRAICLCKDAEVLPPHPDRYERAMRSLLQRALPYSPLIEIGDADGHLFLDATGTCRLFGPPLDVAWRMRRQVKNDLGLDPIWSVASNKLVAKVATRLVKPDGECMVAAGEEKSFLAPLPVGLVSPGCAVWTDLTLPFLLSPLPQGLRWSLVTAALPNDRSLVGVRVSMQAAFDPLPLSLSNALLVKIGL